MPLCQNRQQICPWPQRQAAARSSPPARPQGRCFMLGHGRKICLAGRTRQSLRTHSRRRAASASYSATTLPLPNRIATGRRWDKKHALALRTSSDGVTLRYVLQLSSRWTLPSDHRPIAPTMRQRRVQNSLSDYHSLCWTPSSASSAEDSSCIDHRPSEKMVTTAGTPGQRAMASSSARSAGVQEQ